MVRDMSSDSLQSVSVAAGDVERKVALLLEHGVRKTRRAAEMFVAHRALQRLDVADYQHRIELLRMYGCPLDAVYSALFKYGLLTRLLPMFAYLEHHQYAPSCLPPAGCESRLLLLITCFAKVFAHAQGVSLRVTGSRD